MSLPCAICREDIKPATKQLHALGAVYHDACWKEEVMICARCRENIVDNYAVINLEPNGELAGDSLPIFLHHKCVEGSYGVTLTEGAASALREGRTT